MRIATLSIALLLPALVPVWSQSTEADEASRIVHNAIQRRLELRRGESPFAATIHTTSTIEVSREGSRVALIPEGTIAQEAVGTLFRDPALGTRIRIHARRGNAGPAGIAGTLVGNFQSLGEYFSIEDDEIVLLNTAIAFPLAEDASRYYSFQRAGESTRNGIPVYEIDVRAATRLHPVFEGKLFIARSTFDLVEMDLHPSDRTAIPFVTELRLVGRFSPVNGGAYGAESLELKGKGEVVAVAFGLVEPQVEFSLATMLSDRRFNAPIPDSIRAQLEPIVVLDNADSVAPGFWQGRSRLTATQIDAITRNSAPAAVRRFGFSALPYIDYNRAGGASLGGSATVSFGPATIGGMGGYSFGLDRPIGEATVAWALGGEEEFQVTPRAAVFSRIETTTTGDKSYPRIMNTLVAASLHQDYYNFYRKDGWSAGADITYDPVRLSATFERSRQFSIGNNARWALLTWTSKEFQENPPITDGNYQTAQADLSWGRVTPFLKITPVAGGDLRWSLSGMTGEKVGSDTNFRLVEALVSYSLPVVRTGYNPMTLTLLGAGGVGTATLPPQYQFRLRTSAASFGKPGGFVSPPKGLYGGTEYMALGAEFNVTDFWWRALNLPTWNGRGVELILAGGSARYRQRHHTGYTGTGDLWYSEAGLALSRIPLFLTDLIYGRVDARWGLGPLRNFGANFTFVVPL